MKDQIKSITSLMTLVMLGLTFACDANAGPSRDKRSSSESIRACVAEIGRHADFQDASRVVYWVANLDQRNLVETEIRIEASVYLKGDDAVGREYAASCVTGAMGDIVNFRIEAIR